MKEYLRKSWKYHIGLIVLVIIIRQANNIINMLTSIFMELTGHFSDTVQIVLAISLYIIFSITAYIIAIKLDKEEKNNDKLS